MASTPSKAIEQATRRAVRLEQLKSHEARLLRSLLEEIQDTLLARIARAKPETWTRRDLEAKVKAYQAIFKQGSDEQLIPELNRQIAELAKSQAAFEVKSLGDVAVNYQFKLPTEKQLLTAVRASPLMLGGRFEGTTLGRLADAFTDEQMTALGNSITAAFAQGETTTQLMQRLVEQTFPASEKQLETVVRTSLQHAAGQARQSTYQANSDIIKGYRIVATLDGRTSFECRARDGEEMPLESVDLPPYHFNCRTTFTAVLDDRFSFLEEGATRAARDPETGKIERIPAKQTYYQWLKEQDRPFVESVIGPERAKLLLDGNMSAKRFSEMQLGRRFEPLPLKEIARLEEVAVGRATPLSSVDVVGDREKFEPLLNSLAEEQRQLVDDLPKPAKVINSRDGYYDGKLRELSADPSYMQGHQFLHEYGHHVDKELGQRIFAGRWQSASETNKAFSKAIAKDAATLNITPEGGAWRKPLNRLRLQAGKIPDEGVSHAALDILDAMSRGNMRDVFGGPGHGSTYYMRSGTVEKETFANLFAVRGTEHWQTVKELFPETAKRFDKIVKDAIK